MQNKNYKYIFSLIISAMLTACNENTELSQVEYGEENYIRSIAVALPDQDLTDFEDDGDSVGETSEEENPQEWKEINTNDYTLKDIQEFNITLDDNSTVFVSQMTAEIPAFQNDDVTYTYSHIPNSDDATWEQGYNFTPKKDYMPLEWYKIGNGGTYHGGFALYAMHFPLENKIRQKIAEDGTSITYSVMKDQRKLEDLMRSDVLGAYHSTSELFSRLRFKLHHMMAYIRVRLYVPVYDDVTHTGFQENAVEYATIEHVTPDFGVEWSASRSSDSQGPKVVALSGDETIYMYQHPLPEDMDEHKKGLIKYKDFIGDYYDQGITGDYDKVRIYDFSVILPEQKVEDDINGFLSSQFLNFYLRSNSGALNRYYFTQELLQTSETISEETLTTKSGSTYYTDDLNEQDSEQNTDNSTDTSGSLQIEPENLQYIQLYVPRVGNKIIYIKASVGPWKQRSTKLALSEKKEN